MSRHVKASAGQQVGGVWFRNDELTAEAVEALGPLLDPEVAPWLWAGVSVTGRDAHMYWMGFTPAPDADNGTPDDYGLTITLREVHEDDEGSIVRGPVVSRRVVGFPDMYAESLGDADPPEGLTDEDVIAAVESPDGQRAIVDAVREMLAIVGVEWTDEESSTRILGPGAGRDRSRDVPTVGEAVAEAWPHDGWSGTPKQVHALVGGEDGPYSLDAVKKALQRGEYESTETPGQASTWRRVPRRR